MIPRRAMTAVRDALDRQAAVALLGPRQVGKTTLALEIAKGRPSVYLDLDDPTDRAKIADVKLFLSEHTDKLVILDEIHRTPELFRVLRGVIDQGRRRGQRTGRFLMLGSASIDLLRQSGESLAGRIAYVELGPVAADEHGAEGAALSRLWVRGGFPDSLLAKGDAQSLAVRRDFIRTYLERDIPEFGPRVPAETLGRLWTMLAHHHGGLANASSLARDLSVSPQSVTRYIDLLSDLLVLRRLPPHHANLGKRLVKSPKVYIRDSGLLHALIRLGDLDAVLGHPIQGASWEGFVIENLLQAAPPGLEASFYRTAAGAEIDLLLRVPGGAMWAIEIKRSSAPRLERGFHQARVDLRPARSFVVYGGDERFPLAEDLEAIGLVEMMAELRALSG